MCLTCNRRPHNVCSTVVVVLTILGIYIFYYNMIRAPYLKLWQENYDLRTKAREYLQTNTCTDPERLARLENYNLCAVSKRRNETSVDDIAYTLLLQQWSLCDDNGCTVAGIDLVESMRAYIGIFYWATLFGVFMSVFLLCMNMFGRRVTATQMPVAIPGNYATNVMMLDYYRHINDVALKQEQMQRERVQEQQQLSGGARTMYLGNEDSNFDNLRRKKHD